MSETLEKMGMIDQQDVERMEQGLRLPNASYLTGGSMKNPERFYPIAVLLNWLPLLPRLVVDVLVRSRLYRLLAIESYYLSTVLPRAIYSLLSRRDLRGRSHMRRFVDRLSMKTRLARRVP